MANQSSDHDRRVQLARPEDACQQLKVGKTKFWKLVSEGEVEVVRFGPRCTRALQPSIDALIERKRTGGPAAKYQNYPVDAAAGE